jgi:hypothetical protein
MLEQIRIAVVPINKDAGNDCAGLFGLLLAG